MRSPFAIVVVAITLLFSILYANPVAAQEDPWEHVGDESHGNGQIHVSTAKYNCLEGVNRQTALWTAPFDLWVTRVWIWIGTDAGAPGQPYPQVDAYAAVYTSRPMGYRLGFTALDRYAAPNGPHDKELSRVHRLHAGDVIRGGFHCSPLFKAVSHIQVMMTVEYARVLP